MATPVTEEEMQTTGKKVIHSGCYDNYVWPMHQQNLELLGSLAV